jgi:HEPN domain-containing protein
MSGLREELRRAAREWAQFAEDDLHLARHALEMGCDCPYRLVAYHAQQCAEKYLKAYLVLKAVDFPRTHNISLLVELCMESACWAHELKDAEQLTVYGIVTRYPGGDRAVTEAEARRAIALATEVAQKVREALADAGLFE